MHRARFIPALLAMALLATAVPALGQEPESRAQQLARNLAAETGGAGRISYHERTGLARFLDIQAAGGLAPSLRASGANPAERAARSFMAGYGPLFGITDQAAELETMRSRDLPNQRSLTRFRQKLGGLPVLAGEFKVVSDAAGRVLTVAGKAAPSPAAEPDFKVEASTARDIALRATASREKVPAWLLEASGAEQWLYNPSLLGPGANLTFPVWKVEVIGGDHGRVRELVLIEARSGAVALIFNQNPTAINRLVYDCQNGYENCPQMRDEGSATPSGLPEADDAYEFLGDAYTYYSLYRSRDSIDDAGMTLEAFVRVCPPGASCPWNNAQWNGAQLGFGEGFVTDDILGHEYTHGVTQYESGLYYWMQSGAINESYSDIFGELIDLFNITAADTAAVKWLMGEDRGFAMRDMADPTTRNDPDRMRSPLYVCGTGDQGGVHSNSGVGNKAAYLMAEGGTFNGVTMSGLGTGDVSNFFYRAQTDFLTSGSDYADLADALEAACVSYTGNPDSWRCQMVSRVIQAVEMRSQPVQCAAPEAPVCPAGVNRTIWSEDFESSMLDMTAEYTTGPSDIWEIGTTGDAAGGLEAANGYAPNVSSDSLMISRIVNLSEGCFLHFDHSYNFEPGADGGVVEIDKGYKIGTTILWNNGTPTDDLFTHNGYNSYISALDSPLRGRNVFSGTSNGWMSSRIDLRSMAGAYVRIRFRIGTDGTNPDGNNMMGWHIDNVRIVECKNCPNIPWLLLQ